MNWWRDHTGSLPRVSFSGEVLQFRMPWKTNQFPSPKIRRSKWIGTLYWYIIRLMLKKTKPNLLIFPNNLKESFPTTRAALWGKFMYLALGVEVSSNTQVSLLFFLLKNWSLKMSLQKIPLHVISQFLLPFLKSTCLIIVKNTSNTE